MKKQPTYLLQDIVSMTPTRKKWHEYTVVLSCGHTHVRMLSNRRAFSSDEAYMTHCKATCRTCADEINAEQIDLFV